MFPNLKPVPKKAIAPRFQLGGIIKPAQTCSACKKS